MTEFTFFMRFTSNPSSKFFLGVTCWALTCLISLPLPRVEAKQADPQQFKEDPFYTRFMKAAGELHKSGKLLSLEQIASKPFQKPVVSFPQPLSQPLSGIEVAERLRASTIVLGLFYKCHHCSEFHFSCGTGFAVAKGGIVSTCAHVMTFRPKEMLEAYPIAVDAEGTVYPIDSVLAFDEIADTCLVQLTGADKMVPLPLRTNPKVGESVFCLSHPDSNFFMFTTGVVSRLTKEKEAGRDLNQIAVSCDYSPGSSGGPIVDSFGNVLAQVNWIKSQLMEDDSSTKNSRVYSTVYNLRVSTGAEEIQMLGDVEKRQPMPMPEKPAKTGADDKKKAEKPQKTKPKN